MTAVESTGSTIDATSATASSGVAITSRSTPRAAPVNGRSRPSAPWHR
jgi:hypothetical protein